VEPPVERRLAGATVLIDEQGVQVHPTAARSMQLDPVGTPVGLHGVAHLSQDGQGRLFAPHIQVDVQVAVCPGLVTHEGVNAPTALKPEATSQRGERRQHVKDLGKSRLRSPDVVGHYVRRIVPSLF